MSKLHDAVRKVILDIVVTDDVQYVMTRIGPLLAAGELMHTELSSDHTVSRCEAMDTWDAAVAAITEGTHE